MMRRPLCLARCPHARALIIICVSLFLFCSGYNCNCCCYYCHAFSIPVTRDGNIRLKTAPLIGGPKWLPLHVKVIIVNDVAASSEDQDIQKQKKEYFSRFDYVPLNPTSIYTLLSLISLKAVPAHARCRIPPSFPQAIAVVEANDDNSNPADDEKNGEEEKQQLNILYTSRIEYAKEYCVGYDKKLHLLSNNCWTFALDLTTYILKREKER